MDSQMRVLIDALAAFGSLRRLRARILKRTKRHEGGLSACTLGVRETTIKRFWQVPSHCRRAVQA